MLPRPRPSLSSILPYTQGKAKAGDNKPAIKLSSNESSLGPSPKVFDAIKQAYKGLHRYPDGSHASLKQALAEVHNLPVENIICGNGSDELIDMLIRAYAGEDDEVIHTEHGFLMYAIYAKACGARPVSVKEKNLTADIDNILAAVTPRTRLVFLANPNNPTGSYLPVSEVRRLRDNLRSDIILVLDAAYAEYPETRDYSAGNELVAEGGNTVVLRTFSKAYALPLLRLGWGYMPTAIIENLNKIRSPFNVNGLALAAGEVAARDQKHMAAVVAHNSACLAELPAQFEAIGVKAHKSVANFLLLQFPPERNAQDANKFLLDNGIILREVGNYGLPDCLRMTIGLGVENSAVIDTLKKFMGK